MVLTFIYPRTVTYTIWAYLSTLHGHSELMEYFLFIFYFYIYLYILFLLFLFIYFLIFSLYIYTPKLLNWSILISSVEKNSDILGARGPLPYKGMTLVHLLHSTWSLELSRSESECRGKTKHWGSPAVFPKQIFFKKFRTFHDSSLHPYQKFLFLQCMI